MKTTKDITISTQDYEILDSGCVIIQSGQAIEFVISGLCFKIIFIDEPTQNGVKHDGRVEIRLEHQEGAKDYLGVYLYNQYNAFFASTPDLLDMATIDNRKLYLKLSIQSINSGSSDKILFYSWYWSKNTSQPINNSSATE